MIQLPSSSSITKFANKMWRDSFLLWHYRMHTKCSCLLQ
jgi:hypothetical protein